MRAIGFTGESGSGKTTLIEALIRHFSGHGVRTAAIKHAHHGFDMDRPGKDSFRFRAAGARQVLVASELRWALLADEEPGAQAHGPEGLRRQLQRLAPCELVFVEGYRGQAQIPYIEVRRAGVGGGALREGVVAVATDLENGWPGAETLDLNDIAAVADFVERSAQEVAC